MSDIAGSYRFLLNGILTEVVFGNEFGFDWEKAEDSFYFRKKLKDKIEFPGVGYTTILESTTSFRHTLTIQKFDGSIWNSVYDGFFYKTDCNVNEDDSIIDVKPLPNDGFEDIKKILNNEYNLVDLAPIATPVTYKLRPILQIVSVFVTGGPTYSKSNTLTNISGFSYWEETLDKDYTPTELESFGFVGVPIVLSGTYFYQRYLTTLETFDGVATTNRQQDDISSIASFYNKISVEGLSGQSQGGTIAEPTRFGRALNYLDGSEYFEDRTKDYTFGSQFIPINPTTAWGNFIGPGFEEGGTSFWLSKQPTLNDFELDNSDSIQISEVYKMPDVIQLLLSQETDIVHQETSEYSEFFYDTIDPIAGEDINIFFTPKSNIVNAFYTNPARKSLIRLSDVLNLADAGFRTGWHIDKVGVEKRLRIEHISWYENGGTYGPQKVSIDLTQSFDSRVNKPQSFNLNKYSYLKSNMPQRFEFAYDNDTSAYFNGDPINVLADQVNLGAIEKKDTQGFTPEINNLVARTDISLDGFVVFSAELVVLDYIVNMKPIEISEGLSFDFQNGLLSFFILHPNYHGYGMPAEDIEINGEATTALSITRNKQQEIEFVSTEDIDPLNLIRTGVGAGQVDKISLNIVSNTYKATINHDTE